MKLLWWTVCLAPLAGLLGAMAWAYTPDMSRVDLETAYHVTRNDYIDVAGVRLRLRDTGAKDAPAVVLLYGFGSSLETWDAWSDALSGAYRVVRFDLPGFGLSSPAPSSDDADARDLSILAALMDRLGIAQARFVGNSLGGKLAWMFAARHPERVARLILISPDGFASAGFEYGKKPAIPIGLRLLPYVLPRSLVRLSLRPAYADPDRLTDATVDRYRDFMRAPGVRAAMLRRMAQTILEPPEPLLRRIRAPTLLLWGEKDGMIPNANASDYLTSIANVRLVRLDGLGHVPQEEAPAVSLRPVRDFLR